MAINSKSKGSTFERLICKQLSLWWSNGDSDAIFHRSVTSGGFATNRAKAGKTSANSYGDIMALDAIGKPLLDVCCFELKCGYGQWDILHILDRKPGSKPSPIEKFWEQAQTEANRSGAQYPVVIAKRDRKIPLIIVPKAMIRDLQVYVGRPRTMGIQAVICETEVWITPFSEWLEYVTPEAFSLLAEKFSRMSQ